MDQPTKPQDIEQNQSESGVIRFDNQEAAQQALLNCARGAQREVAIYCHSLEPTLYAQSEFIDELSRVARRHRSAIVRLLIQNPKSLYGCKNPLVTLSQRLPSSVQLRTLTEEHSNPNAAFCIADGKVMVFFNQEASTQGFYCREASAESRHALDEFNHLWLHYSAEDAELKAITL